MHVLVPDQPRGVAASGTAVVGAPATTDAAVSPRVGFVVSKAVGNSVVRHRVVRKLRHVLRERLGQMPPGSRLVVRALPKSATANSTRLAADVDRALRTLLSADSR